MEHAFHKYQFTAHIEFDEESKMYYGYVPSLPAVQSYAETVDQLNINLAEVLSLVVEELSPDEIEESISHFIGTSIVLVEK